LRHLWEGKCISEGEGGEQIEIMSKGRLPCKAHIKICPGRHDVNKTFPRSLREGGKEGRRKVSKVGEGWFVNPN